MTTPLKVLMLEDRDDDARLLAHTLTTAGFALGWQRVDTEAAFVAALDPSLDVVLADYHLPGWDAQDALARLQARGWDIPFILVSGTIGEEAAADIMRLGATDFVLKEHRSRLASAVRRALSERQLRTERRALEDRLRDSERRYLALSEAAVEAVAFHDQGILVDFNSAFETLFGYTRQELLGRSILDLAAPGDHSRVIAVIASNANADYETMARRKDGSTFRSAIASRVIVHDGKVLRVAVIRDVSERHIATELLRESEARFREFAATVHDVFYIVDALTGLVAYVSPGYERVSGRTAASLYADRDAFRSAILPADRPIFDDAVSRRRTGAITDIEYRFVRADGEIRWIRDHSYPVMSATGAAERIVGTARDVTDYRRAGDLVRAQAALLDKAQDAIVVRELDDRVTYWNKSAERLYGWAADEVIGRVWDEGIYKDPVTFRRAAELVRQRGEWMGELHLRNKFGRDVITESRWTLVRDSDGHPQHILAINTDITERKTLEQQFLRSQRLESIGTLAGGIAHDLNNILTPIRMSIALLEESVTDDAGRILLSTIAASASRGAQVVGQVLSFARGVESQRISLDPARVINEVAGFVRETFPKNIRLRVACETDGARVLGDATQLHQVLLNLCVNARDAMPDGGELTLSATSTIFDQHAAAANIAAQVGPYLIVGVDDSGTGMAPEVIEKIFDPFFTTKELGKGTGLGLSTSLAIIKGHGGFIDCQSTPGLGTQFRLYLPSQMNVAATAPAAEALALVRGDGYAVLMVDDEPMIRLIARRAMEAYGYQVFEAANGRDGVRAYVEHQAAIDLVLVDMMMPVMDGAATIEALRRINPAVRIVAASGTATEDIIASLGVRGLLPKPYGAEDLLVSLHRALNDQAP